MKLVSAVFLMRKDGAVLLQHRDDKLGIAYRDHWSLPSGHMAQGETPMECARRELYEETGYQCQKLEPLCVIRDSDEVDGPYTLHIFGTRYDEAQEISCFEGQQIRFLLKKDLQHRKIPHFLIGVWDAAIEKGLCSPS